jgi:hypothetical protein
METIMQNWSLPSWRAPTPTRGGTCGRAVSRGDAYLSRIGKGGRWLIRSTRKASALRSRLGLGSQRIFCATSTGHARCAAAISGLVRKGLEVEIQQSMDVLQVLRKNPWERSHFDWIEDKETATKLFNLLRDIVGRRMLERQAAV